MAIVCLGITSVGALLQNNEIVMTDMGCARKGISLRIPPYQRPYKWIGKNVSQLFNDIQEALDDNKSVYRVGTLILHYGKDKEGEGYIYDIVDGQQRIVSFALMLSAFYKVIKEKEKETEGKRISHLEEKPISFLEEKLANNADNRRNVANNYRTLERRIGEIGDLGYLEKLYEFVITRCELIVVVTDNLSEAFQFFDSQNARGKALYPHDLLKAYHLREMADVSESETEQIVKTWEDLNQAKLSELFSDYLYRLKEWVKGNRPIALSEQNIDIFKGVSAHDNAPFAQYAKSAFAYAEYVNESLLPFVTGIQPLGCFQIDAPIIAGKPFFEYAKHYYDVLLDIQNNNKYEGYFVNGNKIVDTLNLDKYAKGTGNRITRLMFDSAILLYVDRFCPMKPSQADIDCLERFITLAFIWAYSMRAQYKNVGWAVAQNYIEDKLPDNKVNGGNLYKLIAESDSTNDLLGKLSDWLEPLPPGSDKRGVQANLDGLGVTAQGGKGSQSSEGRPVQQNYLQFFIEKNYWKYEDYAEGSGSND